MGRRESDNQSERRAREALAKAACTLGYPELAEPLLSGSLEFETESVAQAVTLLIRSLERSWGLDAGQLRAILDKKIREVDDLTEVARTALAEKSLLAEREAAMAAQWRKVCEERDLAKDARSAARERLTKRQGGEDESDRSHVPECATAPASEPGWAYEFHAGAGQWVWDSATGCLSEAEARKAAQEMANQTGKPARFGIARMPAARVDVTAGLFPSEGRFDIDATLKEWWQRTSGNVERVMDEEPLWGIDQTARKTMLAALEKRLTTTLRAWLAEHPEIRAREIEVVGVCQPQREGES